MLFSGLQSQHVSGLAVGIHRLTHDTSRKFSHHLFAACHETQIRTSECHRKSQRLTFSHRDICTIFCRCFQNAERDRVYAHDVFCTGFVNDLADSFCVLQVAVVVGMLDVNTGNGFIHMFFQIVQIGHAVLFRDDLKFHLVTEAVCLHGLKGSGKDCCGNQRPVSFFITAHCDAFCGRFCSVVYGSVGCIHTSQIADHRLIFEDGLEQTLADLSLVRSVGCLHAFVGKDAAYNGRDIVVICSCAAENRREYSVFCSDSLHDTADFQFGFSFREIKAVF